jgi:hypothetical protein
VVLLSGEGDYLGVILDVFIRSDGDLTAFNMRQLDPLRVQLSLDGFPCVPSRQRLTAPFMVMFVPSRLRRAGTH